MSRSPAKKSGKVLVVDDHAAARESVADVLRHASYEVVCSSSAVEALPLLLRTAESERPFDVVITDLQMPGMDGLEFIHRIAQQRVRTQVLMITAHATIASAVEAMRQGAFDYLEKPFNATQLEELVAQAMKRRSLLLPDAKSAGAGAEVDHVGMIGDSPAMGQLRRRIEQVAPTDETILICGESGTGKELVARAIHALSARRDRAMVSLNCPALSPQLTESELFGHRRGAFTGADVEREGRFALAEGGTIFLDEITEIDLPLQAKLLRVLQERTYELVGSSETTAADVRVLASSNRNLSEEVAAGRFRQDLYYRLAVVPLVLPPLRERGDDVQLLADFFLERASERLGRPVCRLESAARDLFANYRWPGNVRELENIITRASVLNTGEVITSAELRPWLEQPDDVAEDDATGRLPVGTSLEHMERQMIVATLEHYGGHRAKAAQALGIGVRTLSGKLRAYGFAPHTREFASNETDRQEVPNASVETAEPAARKTA